MLYLPETLFAKDEVANPPGIELWDVARSVVPLGGQGEKQGLFREIQGTAVGKQPVNGSRRISYAPCTDAFSYAFNRIRHSSLSF